MTQKSNEERSPALRKAFKNVFYTLVAIGLLDMCVQMITDKKVRIIWSLLDIFFNRP
jgi:hypothetical protein